MLRNELAKTNIIPFLTFFMLALIFSSAEAQNYVPLGSKNPPVADNPVTLKIKDLKSKLSINNVLMTEVASVTSVSGTALPAPAALPECSSIPTVAQIAGSLEYHQSFMSTSAAAKLGIPLAGNINGSGNQMVLVRDFSRGVQCPATDGVTILFYGQVIRMIVAMSSFEGKVDITLPYIAASASLNNKSNLVSVTVNGFASPKIDAVIASIAGKELNVESYSEFITVEKDIIALINDPQTVKSVARLGAISAVPPVNLSENVIIAYALTKIRDRKSCAEAKTSFRSPDNPSATALDETYKKVVGACDSNKPSEIQSLQSKELLLDLKVKY